MSPKKKTQVTSDAYKRNYLTLPRTLTHWHQANEVAEMCPPGGNILEIGLGSGHTTWILTHWGLNVTTYDFDETVKPDIAGDVKKLPFRDGTFDCILIAEVLEHIPFDEFEAALAELRRVSSGSVVLTLPAPFVGISALFNVPLLKPIGIFLGAPYWVGHKFNGEHYWELGKRGFSIQRIRQLIQKQGFDIIREFRPAPSLYCYFFVLTCSRAPQSWMPAPISPPTR